MIHSLCFFAGHAPSVETLIIVLALWRNQMSSWQRNLKQERTLTGRPSAVTAVVNQMMMKTVMMAMTAAAVCPIRKTGEQVFLVLWASLLLAVFRWKMAQFGSPSTLVVLVNSLACSCCSQNVFFISMLISLIPFLADRKPLVFFRLCILFWPLNVCGNRIWNHNNIDNTSFLLLKLPFSTQFVCSPSNCQRVFCIITNE